MESSGKRIETLRRKRKWEQSDLARELKVAQGTVSNWENNGVNKAEDLLKLAKLFGVTSDYILFGNTTAQPVSEDVPEAIYRDLIEANSEYRLIPKSVLEEKYRIVSLIEMEKEERDNKEKKALLEVALDTKDKFINNLQHQVDDLKTQLNQLRSQFPLKQA
jgi:transcriptional regulator with XRE-family HTH domain